MTWWHPYTMDSVDRLRFPMQPWETVWRYPADAGAMENTESKEELPQEASDRKLIRTVNLTVETESFDALMDSIQNKVTELGGYVERMDQNNGASTIRPITTGAHPSPLEFRRISWMPSWM